MGVGGVQREYGVDMIKTTYEILKGLTKYFFKRGVRVLM